jgi:hypothetical protein
MGLLTTGRSVSCEQGTCAGGAGKLYLANANQVSGVTTSSANSSITAITMGSSAYNFYEFEFRDFSANFTETSTQDQDTLAVQVEQTFTGIWTCRNQGDRDILQNLLDQNCGVVAVHVENTGVYWIWGVEVVGGKKLPARLTQSEATSGTALTDPNQSTITITCRTNKMARVLEDGATVIAALI